MKMAEEQLEITAEVLLDLILMERGEYNENE